MTRIGTVHGNRIELEEPLSFPSGTRVRVLILPVESPSSRRLIGLFHDKEELLDRSTIHGVIR